MSDEHVRTTVLANGVKMPLLGLGVLRIADGPEVEQVVTWALETGYRSIDTARVYNNEAGVGRALLSSPVPRDDIFLTTKVWNSDQGYREAHAAFDASLSRLGQEYVDLYLVHWPGGDPDLNRETWRALEEIYAQGRARAIGVSNFHIPHLEALLATAEVVPMVNQVEFHPHLQQKELRAYCSEKGIQLEAWRPLMRGAVVDVPQLQTLAEKLGKTPAQVTLRWMLQLGVVTIPKSQNRNRIKENWDVFDFELSPEDMAVVDALDCGGRLGPDPDTFRMDF